jgi:hypothetical protein
VAEQAVKEGVARINKTRAEVLKQARHDIDESRASVKALLDAGLIKQPPEKLAQEAFEWACSQVK